MMYEELSTRELYLLALHTLFLTGEHNHHKLREAMQSLEGKEFNDMKQCLFSLRNKGLLESSHYNWRSDTYDYRVPDDMLIHNMVYLYSMQSELVIRVLDNAHGLYPSPIQKALWKFISSNYSDVDIETLSNRTLDESQPVFGPVLMDQRFLPLISMLSESTISELIGNTLSVKLENMELIDSDYLRSLIKNRLRDGRIDEARVRCLCLCDLYDYLAYGRMPLRLLSTNKNHCTIAAIHEAYRGNFPKALEHIKKAVLLNNRSRKGFYSAAKPYLPLTIANFFYVLIAHLVATEEGRKRMNAVCKSTDGAVEPAKLLRDILCATGNERILKDNLRKQLTHEKEGNRILAALMLSYIGEPVDYRASYWLIMKQEMRTYHKMNDADMAQADKTFGTKPLLFSVYHKQEWEKVLDELMLSSKANAGSGDAAKKTRLGYFITNTHNKQAEIRIQSVLKNGNWSAGKQVSMARFLDKTLEEMTDSDKRIADAVGKAGYYSSTIPLQFVLPEMTEESRLMVGTYAPYSIVEVTEEMPYITLQRSEMGFYISSNVPADRIDSTLIITSTTASGINFIQLSDTQRMYYRKLLQLGHFPLEAEEQLRRFLASIGGRIEVNSDLIEGGSTLPITDGSAVLTLQMRPQDKETYAVSLFCRPMEGGRIRCTPGKGDEIIVDGMSADRSRVRRDLKGEEANFNHFIDTVKDEVLDIAQLTGKGSMAQLSAYDVLPLLDYAQRHPDRMSCEWPEGARMKLRYRQSTQTWTGAIRKNENGWFEIEGNVELDEGRVLSMAELLDLASQSQGRYIKLGEGEFIALSEKLHRQLSQLVSITGHSRGKLQISPFCAAVLGADMLEGELILTEDEELKQIRQRILDASSYTPRVPKMLNATLREYQKEGYQWMSRLNKWGAGALLADDMGLGKTIQTIAFLLSKAKEGPALVIAPASVAPNWKLEFEKFAPSINVTMLNFAPNRSVAIAEAKAGDVVVTTYGLLLSVKEEVTQKHWTTICLDEAHIVKNRGAKTSAVAMKLRSDNRIMLTGTPVQNHLGELWNLFQFVNPGLLGSFEDFNRRFIVPIEHNGDKHRQADLYRLVKPFMLRRTKDKVARELPEKQEIYQHVCLSEAEQLQYETLRQKAEAMLLAEDGNKVTMNTLAEITRLRQCACDARLVSDSTEQGSKLTALVELLQTILEGIDEGQSGGVLVFSQFTSYLSLIRKALDDVGIRYLYIDGSVDIRTREQLVADFQRGTTPVFLISLKAGGLGLNLTRANYVVHMDPWWNPAIEAQATDRAHRIGQKQSVTVYHLLSSGTIEEKIYRLHQRKQALVEDILSSTDISHKLTGEELLEMVGK